MNESWECIGEDDCIRSCLIEVQSRSIEQAVYRPIAAFPDAFSTVCLHDARRRLVKSSSCFSQ